MKTRNSTEKDSPSDFINEIEAMLPPERARRARRKAKMEILEIKTCRKHSGKKKTK